MACFGNRRLNAKDDGFQSIQIMGYESTTTDSRVEQAVNQALIDEIVSNVLAKLQPISSRAISLQQKPSEPFVNNQNGPLRSPLQVDTLNAPKALEPSVRAMLPIESKPSAIELMAPVITADLLEKSVHLGQTVKIGRTSILTPSARDWLHTKRTAWSRIEKSGSASGTAQSMRPRWQVILQTMTPNLRALQDGLRRWAEGWKIELVGQPSEAIAAANSLISTSECDGVVIFTEQAELIACRVNRNERIRAAVIHDVRQWEQVTSRLGVNVACVNPIGRTFIELRNLLRDCAGRRPQVPEGW